MTRLIFAAATALLLAAAPVLAQTTPPQAPKVQTPAADPAPGSQEWLRLRGESYSAAPDSEQDPAEVAATIRLNAEIVARNDAAERAEIEGTAAWEAENARWRAETARLETQRAQWEADAAAAEAARLRYERERAAWEAEVAACQRSGRPCLTAAPKY
ncbi:cell wall hydrolase [Brevundimonas sp.]|uniref:cell wall hydrolase n=1 Tax=Brevundimonas sp. TaxID=1871086 RepID=UPI002737DDC5|nr:cell wall hydrolase [Brevundimonas sp.]MDP3803452.1 cell wall hydrolase [Brevundimonas sp.]